ncbi:MAG: hypothetical protein L3J47_03690 [Sulfurovum sp.]|nr:hypothetical protein [Sulfurovum sp.]
MKKMMAVAAGIAGIFMISGCGQSIPNPLDEKECATLEKKMIQTDTFIENVSAMDPAHVEEMLAAVPQAEITKAMTKQNALKDAKRRKARLEAQFQSAGCKKEF